MIERAAAYAADFADAGSDLIAFHVEADDDLGAVIDAIQPPGGRPGSRSTPKRRPNAVHPYLDRIDLLLVMTVHPGLGGQAFMAEVLPEARGAAPTSSTRGAWTSRSRSTAESTSRPSARAYAAGGEVLVVGSALYGHEGDLAPTVAGRVPRTRARHRTRP